MYVIQTTIAATTLLVVGSIGRFVSADQPAPHRLSPVPIQQVKIEDEFWSPMRKVWREVTIPDMLAKFEKTGAITNFDKVAAGTGAGKHGGKPWYDGLTYETIRGCADFLVASPNPELEKRIDDYICRIAAAAAKDPNGYLNTWTQLQQPNQRWGLSGGNIHRQHDIYNAGAMVEAAVHYYRATGKTELLTVATRLTNRMADLMGPPPRRNIVPGHALPEEALVELYRLFREQPELKNKMPVEVDEERYLRLAEFWIENRGNDKGRKLIGFVAQDHECPLRQKTIEGHAVRATLLCAGMVVTGEENGRQDYRDAVLRLWDSMANHRMHITGGVGVVRDYEGFAADYELPNNAYLETCAAVGACFFHRNMNLAFADARYADELERTLYNGALCGVSLAGNSYTYQNPLVLHRNQTRWTWHGCPCCPPMFLKMVGAMPGYIFAKDDSGVYVNLFVGSRAKDINLAGTKLSLHQDTRYPWDGRVQIEVNPQQPASFDLNLRIP
ncbi:MAG: glycoside hydrolase family 127 protein, partial [Pirellulales bacterium]|nr:glycoside hydrolase family 127 protein [Pirellulales bacterium]